MRMWRALAGIGMALVATISAAPAFASGPGLEADYARANGRWGGEFGAGYSLGFAGFSLTPGAGVFVRGGSARLYGRVEATYAIPAMARIGAGVRISGSDPRPYGTVALPVLPKVAVKGNAGPKYFAAGLTLGF
ncbi:hypothetical protein HL653_19290 [Sphingomonas sp. AP4-R1]|uniref:hypothetical protein n=1 Tax=Sphingomonas sp. AP4-R1 TaxID=2735134 RepID=UPI001493AAD1|nr:hypothetical protein [Sphingomonas sp. AP4-R1]QJU60818.1 hypothetical protein HL653_19290 [Sphingomonas sp. AP4-R1]